MESADSIAKWITTENMKNPVIILHHEAPSSYHYTRREMLSTNSTSVQPLTEFQISQYQVGDRCI